MSVFISSVDKWRRHRSAVRFGGERWNLKKEGQYDTSPAVMCLFKAAQVLAGRGIEGLRCHVDCLRTVNGIFNG